MPLLTRMLLTLFAITAMGGAVNAQLQANFTASTTGGCSPLTVTFTNTTTGASAGATYAWDFGNGNKTTTTDLGTSPGATYAAAQAYTVTLTVTDGAKTSTKTVTVTVYKPPTVSFSATGGTGCAPVTMTFTSTSTAGDGAISQYFWDFGNGDTKSATGPAVTETYAYAGSPTVGLTVTNSYGCSATLSQNGLVTVSPALAPSFTVDSPILCQITDPELFTNTTTGPGTLTYLWRFGDGTTAGSASPSHVYGQRGTYDITLIATSSIGCVDSVTKPALINADNFQANFTVPPIVCTNTFITLADSSTPRYAADFYSWRFSDNNSTIGATYSPITYDFLKAGTFNVTMTALFGACSASITKTIKVGNTPTLTGFLIQDDSLCGAPTVVNYKDTSKAAVSWAWYTNLYYGGTNGTPFANTASSSYTYTGNANYFTTLVITNAEGCTAQVSEPISVEPPSVYVNLNTTSPTGTTSCSPITIMPVTTSSVRLVKYFWDFGDGTKSTDSLPTHTYSTVGTYNITFQYTTVTGCTGSINLPQAVDYMQKPKADFKIVSPMPLCGNTPLEVLNTSQGDYGIYWYFGDGSGDYSDINNLDTHQYTTEGTYTITLIAVGYYGFCRDTLTKVDSVTVLPAFPKIESDSNTCIGDRGDVFLKDSLRGAVSASWDFGDGSTQATGPVSGSVVHNYAKTGTYKVVLIAKDGACTTRDSVQVYVLRKQKPLLSTAQTSVCTSDQLTMTVSNLDTNYYSNLDLGVWNSYYFLNNWQYGDGTSINTGYIGTPGGMYPLSVSGNYTSYTANMTRLTPGEDSIRVITTTSGFMNCYDTSNYIVVKITGPIAAFSDTGFCYHSPELFRDSSRGTGGVPLVSWAWNFGDGTTQTLTGPGSTSHTYTAPGTYYPWLKVTDANGCSYTTEVYDLPTNAYQHTVGLNGPQANFYWVPANITPGTTATFYNSSTGPYTSDLWTFKSDGSTSTSLYSVDHTYPNITTDTVSLILYNYNQPGYCATDTMTQVIQVRNVNAAFTYTTSYVNNTNCPPVVVYFTSTSYNVTSYLWDFGDGATAQGNPNPSHTYGKPGKYYINLTATGANNTTIDVTDSIIVKGPYATVSADVVQSCAPSTVTLTALAVGAVSYTWDFGDGTVLSAADTFATHTYTVPGVYNPAVILKDSLGCGATFNPSAPIVVDSLSAQAQVQPGHLCDSGTAVFGEQTYSLSNSKLGETLRYHWDFGTGNPADTANTATTSWKYTALGDFTIRLTVTSGPGCVSFSKESVQVTATAHGSIAGPAAACAGDTLHYTASALRGTPVWQWSFPGGGADTSTNAMVTAATGGAVQLITTWNGCSDTATMALAVHALPNIDITPDAPRICQGAAITLTAHDGQVYQWKGLAATADLTVTPPAPTTFYVIVTNAYGCVNTDSVYVFVAQPFQIQLPADTTLCIGDSMYLQAAGAYAYQWSTGATVNPLLVDPSATTTYTVTGTDQDRCFTSTAAVNVQVVPRPTVRATPVGIVIAGSSVNLQATGSPDIATWLWTPPDYLNCPDCQNPVSTPQSNILYTVTGSTTYGCTASDTVRIRLVCMQDRVAIPGAFSPNHDGHNDLFYPKGSGVRVITSFLIYGRWGTLVFERHNIPLDDPANAWDGTLNGVDQPVGAYVYELTLVCDTGETFTRKGTVLLER